MTDEVCAKQIQIFRPVLGVLYLVGAFVVFVLVLSGKTDIAWKDVALIIVGALITKSGTIVDWAFGSSKGSEDKTNIIAGEKK